MAVSIVFWILVAKYKSMVIGRENEIALLNQRLNSSKSEFIALYGRRRVGKTFLVKSVLEGKFTFQLIGIAQATFKDQLTNFNMAMRKHIFRKISMI